MEEGDLEFALNLAEYMMMHGWPHSLNGRKVRMKISDFIFRYKTRNPNDSTCRVRIYVSPERKITAILSDLGDLSSGTSITNSIEYAYEQLICAGYIDERAKIIEHYEENEIRSATFDFVEIINGSPKWTSSTVEEVACMIDVPVEELMINVENDVRLRREAIKIRNHIDPHTDYPDTDSPEEINRRNEIYEKMVSKSTILDIIESNPGERDLQRLLRSDMSLIAEVYAQPEDEYICFSEFPVGDGFVDFAVFSGRSRMDVILIEIKGADFPIVNTSGYGNLAAKVNEGAQQIRRRLGSIYREYSTFREKMYEILKTVESGTHRFKSFLGPIHNLEVDPNKDVHIHYVVIAGRTVNDVEESRLRHEFEISFSPKIRLESWDTWASKLRRA